MKTTTKSMYIILRKHADKKYNNKGVNKCLILLKKSPTLTESKREKLMLDLFCLTSPIIIKAINNFNNLVKNVPESKVIHSPEDISSECYLGLHRCVLNLKWEDLNKFHFYLNGSLNKIIYRLYEKNYLKHTLVVENKEDNEYTVIKSSGYTHHFDMTDLDISNLDLTEIEFEILKMKVEGQNFQLFLKEKKMNHIEYKKHLDTMRIKVANLYNISVDSQIDKK